MKFNVLSVLGSFCIALASSGSLPITSLDATGNLVFANAGGAPNIVTAPLFLNPQNLSLLTSNPVSLVSAAAASTGNSAPTASLHASSTSADSIQNSLFTVASASGAASTTTTASKAQWAAECKSWAATGLRHCSMMGCQLFKNLTSVIGFLPPCCEGEGDMQRRKNAYTRKEKKNGDRTTFA